jgi:hypothetical protein
MRYRQLAPNNDYSFGNGALNFYYNVPASVGQAVQTGLMLWLNEWFLDNTQGMPWVQGVLGKNTQAMADATIQNYVLNVQGVVGIISYQSTINDNQRSMQVQMTINTVYGVTEVQLENYTLF